MKINLINKKSESSEVGDFFIARYKASTESTIFKFTLYAHKYILLNLDDVNNSIFYDNIPKENEIIDELISRFDFDIIDTCEKENVEINFKLNY